MSYFFIGIKGAGMSALALIIKGRGEQVAGSDVDRYVFTQERLIKSGITIYPFGGYHFTSDDQVIVGAAFGDHFEVEVARQAGATMVSYHQFLGQLANGFYSIAVAGTHGKTTTTSLVSWMLGEECSYLIGDGNGLYRPGSKYFVFEACEYQNHFLAYRPRIGLINNIDFDHCDFFPTTKEYNQAFVEFGACCDLVIYNGDQDKCRFDGVSFGRGEDNDVRAVNCQATKEGISFDLYYYGDHAGTVRLPLIGQQMIDNVLAALAVGLTLGIDLETAITGILRFQGVARRFLEKISMGSVYIDDYAHHPTAIKITIEACRIKYPGWPLVAIFQPDRYSRVGQFAQEFAVSLDGADWIYLLPFATYAAREGATYDASLICQFNSRIVYLDDPTKAKAMIKRATPTVYLIMSSKDQSWLLNQLISD